MKQRTKHFLESLSEQERHDLWFALATEETSASLREQIELVHIAELERDIEEQYKSYGKFRGISTGYRQLDHFTKGLVGGEMIVLAGRTSHGKTTLATNITYNVAKTGKTVLFVTLEMTHTELGSRLRHIHGEPISLPILFQKNDELNWQSIDALLENAKDNGVELVVIDHLHYFTRELDNVAEDLGRITKEMKKNAIRHNLPIVLISHVRKQLNGGRRSTIEDLRGSSLIAQDADIVLMVHRSQEEPQFLDVTIEKNRNRGFDPNDNLATYKFDGTTITENAWSAL